MRIDQIELIAELYSKATKEQKAILESAARILELPITILKSGIQ